MKKTQTGFIISLKNLIEEKKSENSIENMSVI